MTKKCNLAIAAVALGLLSTAYATCYLECIVNCCESGDNLGSVLQVKLENGTTVGPGTFLSTENAWRVDTYSVTKGGFSPVSFNSVCDGDLTSAANELNSASGNNGQGFTGYIRTCVGGCTYSLWSLNQADQTTVNYSQSSHRVNHGGTLCN